MLLKAISYAYCQAGIGYANPLAILMQGVNNSNFKKIRPPPLGVVVRNVY
jgi:hypothetical protein